jgi:hypothetical protein
MCVVSHHDPLYVPKALRMPTSVVAVAVLLATGPVAVLAVCPVGHATQLVGLGVRRKGDAVEHGLLRDRRAPTLGGGERGHKVQK